LTLGVRSVSVKSSSGTTTTLYTVSPYAGGAAGACLTNPLVGATDPIGDQSGNDLAAGDGRPLRPQLFITDITKVPTNREGDWQYGGTGIDPRKVCGSWKAAVRT